MKTTQTPHPQPSETGSPRLTQKWARFTYIGKETSYITNIFKWTELKISFRTTNTLGNLLTHKHHVHDKFSLSGVYKLICPDCNKTYVGLADSSPHATKSIRQPSTTTATYPVLQSTSFKKPNHLAL
jgi:hypothetical protein